MKIYIFSWLILLVFLFSVISLGTVAYAQLAHVKGGNGGGEGSTRLPDYLQYKSYGDIQKDFSIPHRTQDEILDWSNRRVASLMTIDSINIAEHFAKNKKFFIKSGWGEFIHYIDEVKLRETISQRNYTLNSIVEGHMFVKRQGVVAGVYRWLVEVPMLMSFYQKNADGTLNKNVSASAQIDIVITITRVAEGGGPEQMAIAGWQVTQRKLGNAR